MVRKFCTWSNHQVSLLGLRLVSLPALNKARVSTSSEFDFLRDQDLISIKPLERAQLETIMRVAGRMRQAVKRDGQIDLCRGKVLANLFYEPSTRTSSSFHTAMLRLGGQV